ncbi:MAG: FkbM family methyltransferase [Porphyrobacter sp.]|nr:FkbM family methyltransferase [Porphyrobacter sp.]
MSDAFDPFWQDAAEHVAALGTPAEQVFGPDGFEALLPGCRTVVNLTGSDDLAVAVLHKGRLDEVPPELLLEVLDKLAPSFANEVFVVLSASGSPLPADAEHWPGRTAMIATALHDTRRRALAPSSDRPQRMAATYVGEGRVLLESAFGHLMLVNGGDTAIVPHLIRDGWFDRNLTMLLGELLTPGMTFVDIGANFGTYTLFGAGRVGRHGRVVAIEPSPAIAELLRQSVEMNGFLPNCAVVECAAGAEAGTLVLHEFAARQGGNTMLPHIAERATAVYGESVTTREVAVRTLDAIVAEQDLERLDLVKIDVEGFEREVLMGSRETLARFRPKLVIEWHNDFFEGRPEAARALYDLLTGELGYSLHRIVPGAQTRPVSFADLRQGHSDLLAQPA